ncbi:ACP S-malonyltransferase [Sulfuriroseicoccus oceanibius]|uniref:Malonyl CoA-acyl carrier protein transacylase n=1 Tax=Sulfuriroseicoccus oceanibius TaxID=2707525 RepID=A0A6B3L8Z7_9BACT|nr:ACP S-malonyltransferase [Sulfuriroseicoccus oceanibius]QQL45510.1 ACP S-malonyltransferase [Sulfuriroseicoccus oceanibius]
MSTSNDVVVLFSGQGAQQVGMGKDLVAEFPVALELAERADEVLGWKLSEVMFEGPMDELTRTSRCQPALYLHGMMVLEILRDLVPDLNVKAAAGLSLGEFTAHAAAGTFSFEDGLKLVARRGLFMEQACEAEGGAMVALIGGDEEKIKQLAADCDVDVANLNAPGQIVLSGSVEGIDKAAASAKEAAGCKLAKKLPVAGAYHSRLMQSAQDKLAEELAGVELSTPEVPVWSNFLATTVSDAAEIRSALENQVTGSVRWAESMAKIVEGGDTTFLELGPDKALAGMMKRIAKGASVTSIGSAEDVEAFAGEDA